MVAAWHNWNQIQSNPMNIEGSNHPESTVKKFAEQMKGQFIKS